MLQQSARRLGAAGNAPQLSHLSQSGVAGSALRAALDAVAANGQPSKLMFENAGSRAYHGRHAIEFTPECPACVTFGTDS